MLRVVPTRPGVPRSPLNPAGQESDREKELVIFWTCTKRNLLLVLKVSFIGTSGLRWASWLDIFPSQTPAKRVFYQLHQSKRIQQWFTKQTTSVLGLPVVPSYKNKDSWSKTYRGRTKRRLWKGSQSTRSVVDDKVESETLSTAFRREEGKSLKL